MFRKLFCVLICLVASVASNDILGCVGFVKSDVNIDFTKIEIKLHTSDGMLKHQSELAPNNGYYMIPFVEKGEFLLKIEPPHGWIFEPMSVNLNVDGITDPCSNSKEINFHFRGFTLAGKIVNQFSDSPGPNDVTIKLLDDSNREMKTVKSIDGGLFQFKGVLPGSYHVTASHASFYFQKEITSVQVTNGNAVCTEDLVVGGYDVHGFVTSQSLPVGGVHFLLFSKSERIETMQQCLHDPPAGSDDVISDEYPHYICSTTSSSDGRYVFKSLPSANYLVMPFHKGSLIQFDVEPRKLHFTVTNNQIENQKFQVVGFSVKGRVVSRTGGEGFPISNARVFVDGVERGVSDENGFYTLKNMNNGNYQISIMKPLLKFAARNLEVSTKTPQLPETTPDQFAVCGRMQVTEAPSGYHHFISVSVTPNKSSTKLDKDSKFCFYLPPGVHNIQSVISKDLEEKGLAFQPSSLQVEVIDQPISDLLFTQYRADVQVEINCIKSCQDIIVRLGNIKKTISSSSNNQIVVFNDVLPGNHEVKVHRANWCWEEEVKQVAVSADPTQNNRPITFKQTGFLLVCSVSHKTIVDIELNGTVVDTIEMKKHESKLCLSMIGRYNLVPKTCHQFLNPDKLVYDTDHPKHVTIRAIAHQSRVHLITKPRDNLPTTIPATIQTTNKKNIQGSFVKIKSDQSDHVTYELLHWVPGDSDLLKIIPKSSDLIFEPSSVSVTTSSDDCTKVLATFRGIVGKYVMGHVEPATSDVIITITEQSGKIAPITLQTADDGSYRYGPLHPDNTYVTTAMLPDHSLSAIADKPGCFAVKKLSKIIFKVKLDEQFSPLGGVLVAVSGGNYRSSSLTDSNGLLVVSKLEPGQYYFKSMMKEYQFTPASQVIEVGEGREVELEIVGRRIAFSCYGNVTSLNNEPEADVVIRARSLPSADCVDDVIEEAVATSDGSFVVKGLRPGCDYVIAPQDTTNKFSQLLPDSYTKKIGNYDVTDMTFVALRPHKSFYLSGFVATERRFLQFIKISLFRASDNLQPVHVIRMNEESPFFHLPKLPNDGQEYLLRLDSSLSTSTHEFSSLTAGFFAIGPHKHITFQFQPKEKKLNPESTQVSLTTLPLTIICILITYFYPQILSFFQSSFDFIKSKKKTPEISSSKTIRKNRK